MTAANVFGYSTPVWERFTTARHADAPERDARDVEVRATSPAARSVIVLRARAQRGRVREARFRAYGCPTTIAVADWVAEFCAGRAVQDLAALDAAAIRAALEIPEEKTHCALMGEDLVRALMQETR